MLSKTVGANVTMSTDCFCPLPTNLTGQDLMFPAFVPGRQVDMRSKYLLQIYLSAFLISHY